MSKLSELFQVISPIDQSIYAERSYVREDQIERTLQHSAEAFTKWKSISISERISLCKKVIEYFEQHIDEISLELTWQMGRPIQYSPFEISRGFKERAEYMLQIAEPALDDIQASPALGFNRFIRKEPLGTILVLAPWNYPYLTSVNVIIPAIVAGNTVILKHAQQTPLCAETYQKAFEYAGIPVGVFNYIHATHVQVADIIQDQRIQHVAFTGSVGGGQAVQEALSTRFINAGLELGGKDPAYVDQDVDLPNAIENLVDGSFFNSGQSCCGVERIYVHKSLFDEFIHGFVELTHQYQLGNPLNPKTTLGPVVRASAADFIKSQINQAIRQGAQSMIDSTKFTKGLGPCYLAPEVLIEVDHSMRIMTEETFGPVVGIMPVENIEEAVKLMNQSNYGLTASIWTRDKELALHMGDRLETGTVYMNRCDYLDPALAWTGVKDSGRGCTLSALGFDQVTRPKSFHLKS